MKMNACLPIRRKNFLLRLLLITLLCAVGGIWMQTLQAQSSTVVTLAATTGPTAAQPEVTIVNLIGTNFPSGTIVPNQVTVVLQPAITGPALTAEVSAVTTLLGSTRRITFQVQGPNVASPTAYLVSVSGATSTGANFASGNQAALTINPAASIVSMNPTSGAPGQSETVSITGSFTNYVQGATMASFGSGISVGGGAVGGFGLITVTSPTTATAQLGIDPAAVVGSRTVTVATGVQQASVVNGFNVVGVPTLVSVSLNTGQQGQQNESVTLTGQFTHWVQGTTTASFGAGITVASLTINSATSATAVLNIDPAAAAGARNVTVTTGGEVVTLNSGFTVSNGNPVLTTVNPNTGQQGQQNESVTLTGQFTHWVQGTTTASLGAGITVASLTINSATSATAVLNIDPAAAAGARSVTVTTGAEVVTLNNGFTVTNGTPVLTTVNPNTGQQGQQNESVTLTGQFTHWAQGTTTTSFGAGITVASLTINSATSATAVLNIDPAAAAGARNVTVTTGAEVVILNNGFTVSNGNPGLTTVNPNTGQQGQQNESISLTGQFTHWVQGTTTASFGAGITVASLTINSATSATAVLNIDPAAAAGASNVTVTTGGEVVTLNNGFTITSGTPTLTTANPNTGQQGQQNESISLTGQFTHWVQGTTTVSFGAGITVASLTINSATSATAVLNIDPAAATGASNVTVTTGSEVVTLNNGFNLTNGTPTLTTVNPNTGQQGQTAVAVTISGNLTHFSLSSVVTFSGTGITAGAPTTATTTSLTVPVTIAANAPLGAQGVQVVTGAETVSLANAFTVVQSLPVPTISMNSPAPGSQISQPTDLFATITDNAQGGGGITWTVDLARINTNGSIRVGSGVGSVANQKVGTIDPTLIANDTYSVIVTVTEAGQNTAGQFNYDVTSANLKLGNYTTTFADISTQIAGLTITLLREYNSLDVSQGDFGAGWRLKLPGRVSDSTPPGAAFTTSTRAYVTRPDGKSEGFTFNQVAQPFPFFGNSPVFVPDPGVTDTLIPPAATIFCGANGCNDFFGNSYHPTNFVLQTKDQYQYTIDELAGLQQIQDPNGNTITVTATGLTSSTGTSVPFTRDSQGRIISIQGPGAGAPKVTYAYDLAGNLVSFFDQLNNQTQYFYENASFPNYLTRVVDPLGRPLLRNVFDSSGHLIATCNANGNVTTLAGCTTFSQSTASLTQTVISPRGFREDFILDSQGNVLIDRHFLDSTNFVDTVRTYDANNNKLTEKDPAGNVTSYTYDNRGNVLTETQPGNRTTTFTYSSCNQVATSTDPAGHITTYNFDSNCNLVSEVDALGNTTTYQYNSFGEVTVLADAVGNQRTWTYDASGLLTQSTDPFGSITTYQYDPTGYLLSKTDRNGRRIDYQYDAAHNLTQQTWNTTAPRITTYAYDAAGELTGGASPDYSVNLAYDQLGQLISNDQGTPGGTRVQFSYSYDGDGNVINVQDSLGGSTQYTYDALTRVSELVQTGSGIAAKRLDMLYDASNLLTEVRRFADAAGTSPVARTVFQYDCGGCADRITGIGHLRSSDGAILDNLTYTLNPAGNIVSSNDAEGSHQYTYDADGQVLTATHTQITIQPNEFYTYDKIGNRLTSHRSANYVLSYMNGGKGSRLLSDAQFTYVYDAEGNLTRRTSIVDGSHTDFTWDYLNHLTSMVQTSAAGAQMASESYVYDLSGLRIRVVRPQGVEQYFYVGMNPVLVLSGSGTVLSRNLYGFDVDELYAQEQAGQTNWTLLDSINSVRDTVSNAAAPLNHFVYDSFGDLKAHSSPIAATESLFTAREFSTSTSPLVGYFRARYYSPDVGRFISEDALVPFGYSYANNNPNTLTDPLGLSVGSCIRGAVLGLSILFGAANQNPAGSQFAKDAGECAIKILEAEEKRTQLDRAQAISRAQLLEEK